jgi:hypothetical protein
VKVPFEAIGEAALPPSGLLVTHADGPTVVPPWPSPPAHGLGLVPWP